jgi:hypothetical protein
MKSKILKFLKRLPYGIKSQFYKLGQFLIRIRYTDKLTDQDLVIYDLQYQIESLKKDIEFYKRQSNIAESYYVELEKKKMYNSNRYSN